MSIFDFFKRDSGREPVVPQTSIHIKSLEEEDTFEVVVLAITKGSKVLYKNTYESRIYEGQYKEFDDFRGPVYKIDLRLTDGSSYFIFYGIVTDNRQAAVMSMTSETMDLFCLCILKELYLTIPNLFDLHKFEKAPTHYTFYFSKCTNWCYVTNNSGTDSYVLFNESNRLVEGDVEMSLSYHANRMMRDNI